MNHITTIKINKETKQRLDKLKEYSRETYEEVIKKLLFILNVSRKNPEKAQKILNRLDVKLKRKIKQSKPYQDGEDRY